MVNTYQHESICGFSLCAFAHIKITHKGRKMKVNQNLPVYVISGIVFLLVSLMMADVYLPDNKANFAGFSTDDVKTPEYYQALGTRHSVQEMLSNPSLIRVEKTSDVSISLRADGEGTEYGCAYINLYRLSQDRLDVLIKSKTAPKFFNMTDEDLEHAPQFKEIIAATHQIAMPYNKHVRIHFDGIEFIEYEFFLMDKAIEKYGDAKEDYFMKLSEDYEERFANPERQGLSNDFHAPRIIYEGNIYVISGTTFWTSDEHNLRMTVGMRDSVEDRKFITLTEDDMREIPKIMKGIEEIGKTQESVRAGKAVPEPEQKYYIDWYWEKSVAELGSDGRASSSNHGFVYGDEHYQARFTIC